MHFMSRNIIYSQYVDSGNIDWLSNLMMYKITASLIIKTCKFRNNAYHQTVKILLLIPIVDMFPGEFIQCRAEVVFFLRWGGGYF